MSPSGDVMTRLVNPEPAAVVVVATTFAPMIRSFALVVVTAVVALVALLPVAPATTSTGLIGAMPVYSAIRMSGYGWAALNVTVTEFAFASAGAMLAA